MGLGIKSLELRFWFGFMFIFRVKRFRVKSKIFIKIIYSSSDTSYIRSTTSQTPKYTLLFIVCSRALILQLINGKNSVNMLVISAIGLKSLSISFMIFFCEKCLTVKLRGSSIGLKLNFV